MAHEGARGEGDLERFENEVTLRVRAAAEPTTEVAVRELHLRRRDAETSRDRRVIRADHLRPGGDLRPAVVLEGDEAVERLHRTVRLEGHLVGDVDRLLGAGKRAGEVAVVSSDQAGGLALRDVIFLQALRIERLRGAGVPLDFEEISRDVGRV